MRPLLGLLRVRRCPNWTQTCISSNPEQHGPITIVREELSASIPLHTDVPRQSGFQYLSENNSSKQSAGRRGHRELCLHNPLTGVREISYYKNYIYLENLRTQLDLMKVRISSP